MMALIFTFVTAVIMLCTTPAAAAPVQLKFGVFISPRGFSVKKILQPWANWVHDQVGDEVKIKIFAGGILGPDPASQMKLLRDGVQDITFAMPSYTPARFSDLSLLQLPGLVRNSTEGSLAVWRMYQGGLIRGFENVKVVGLFTLDAFNLHGAKPIRSYRDVKGMKLRTGGRIHNDIARALGAVPMGLTIMQIAENINRRVIAGAIIPWTALIPFRINQVASYHYEASLGVLPMVVAMNNGKYQRLSQKAKDVIDKSGDMLARLNGDVFDTTRNQYLKLVRSNPKHTVTAPTPTEKREMKTLFEPLHKKWTADHGVERYDALVRMLAKIRNPR
ncbi:MAG: TRAP transporter substrate-binding protein [Nitrospirales bacterium]